MDKDITKAMDRKEKSIASSQQATQMSIRVSSSLSNAVLIASSRDSFKKMTDSEIEAEILKWRKWLFDLLDINETYKSLTSPF